LFEYGPGSLVARHASWGGGYCLDNWWPSLTLTRLTFTAPDGTEYELRDQLTAGQPHNNGAPCSAPAFSRGTVFVTADGSSATFISNTNIYDAYVNETNRISSPSGKLKLRDGTVFNIVDGFITWMRDRNGNQLTFNYTWIWIDVDDYRLA
jgi:hypothetical protein